MTYDGVVVPLKINLVSNFSIFFLAILGTGGLLALLLFDGVIFQAHVPRRTLCLPLRG